MVDEREMTVRGLAAERQTREICDLDETLQVVFVRGRDMRLRELLTGL